MSCEHIYKLDDHEYQDHSGYWFPCQKCGQRLNIDVETWEDVLEEFGVGDDDDDEF